MNFVLKNLPVQQQVASKPIICSFQSIQALNDHVVKQLAQYGDDAIQCALDAMQQVDSFSSAVGDYYYYWMLGLPLMLLPLLWFLRCNKRRRACHKQIKAYTAVDVKSLNFCG
jgi:hypothetical protein